MTIFEIFIYILNCFKMPIVMAQLELTCSICLETIENNYNILYKCFHKFHKECIDRWLNKNKTCPYCREEDIISMDKHTYELMFKPAKYFNSMHPT
jgi:hypothetical protein